MDTLDDILVHLGSWHYPIIAFCFLRGFPAAYHAMAPTFIAPTLDHWCAKPPELANWTTDQWISDGIPQTHKGKNMFRPRRCEMFEFEDENDLRISNMTRVSCSRWEYDLGDNANTLTNQFDLVCDRAWLRAASQSIYMVGVMVGNILFSHLSDWYGRKRALAFMVPFPLISGILTAFSPSFMLYNIGRFVASIGIGGIQNTTFTLVMESLSARHRALGSLVSNSGWTTGLLTLTGIAWFIRDWSQLQLAISLCFLVLVGMWFMLPESPRWLLAIGCYDRAAVTLRKAAKKNKVAGVDVDSVIAIYKEKMKLERMSRKPTFAALFQYSCLRRVTFIKSSMAMLNTLLYYNLTYSSILFGSNPYLSFALMAAMEYPSRIVSVLFINYVRRRASYALFYGFAAICSLSIIFLPKDPWWLPLCLILLTKLGGTSAAGVQHVQLSELYPTKVRTLATGFAITVSRFGAILAPFTKELGVMVGPWAPRAVDGGVCLTLVCLGLMLPETFKMPLPDNIQDIKQRGLKETRTGYLIIKGTVEKPINDGEYNEEQRKKTEL
ncbi:unnamed protein product [Ixodes persulcatus]